jgi:HK97 family phage prohead protease
MMSKELRSAQAAPEAVRTEGGVTARGYAALYSNTTTIGGAFTEELSPNAFRDSLKDADLRALIDHDSGRIIGRQSAGTLRVNSDDKGLAVEIDLPDTTDGRDLAVLLERGDITGMSFAMRVEDEEWSEDLSTGLPHRLITRASIYEVSAVSFPAYPDTEIGLRSKEKSEAKVQKRQNYEAAQRRLKLKADLAKRILRRP